MQVGWPTFLTGQRGGGCGACSFPLPQQGGANYGEPMYLQPRLRGGSNNNNENVWPNNNVNLWANNDNLWGNTNTTLPATSRNRVNNDPSINIWREVNNRIYNDSTNVTPLEINNIANKPNRNTIILSNDPQSGGGCGCAGSRGYRGGSRVTTDHRGGYRATKKNRKALKKWRKGQRIGFTMTSSLKAKGLIPRTSKKYHGKKVVSAKYKD